MLYFHKPLVGHKVTHT